MGLLLVFWAAGAGGRVGLAFPLLQAGFLMAGVVLTGLGLDGGASVGTSDESRAQAQR